MPDKSKAEDKQGSSESGRSENPNHKEESTENHHQVQHCTNSIQDLLERFYTSCDKQGVGRIAAPFESWYQGENLCRNIG